MLDIMDTPHMKPITEGGQLDKQNELSNFEESNMSYNGKSFVCFCSENASYYNYLIYYFPWLVW